MSVVGKLLVFMNLVFSLVVGTFAVFDYSARTHWAEAYKKLEASNAVERGNAAAYKKEAEDRSKYAADLNSRIAATVGADLVIKDATKAADALVARLAARKTEVDNLATELKAEKEKLAEEKAKLANAITSLTAGQGDTKSSKEDVVLLRLQIGKLQGEVNDAVLAKNKMNDKKTLAEIERDAVQSRNQQLLTDRIKLEGEVKRLASLLQGSGAGGGTIPRRPGGSGRPSEGGSPPAGVEGLVSKVDGNLVKISIGSDSGLAKGQQLLLFRLGTAPKYLGKIEIKEVTASEAVGQAMGRLTGAVQPGDRAGSSIFPN